MVDLFFVFGIASYFIVASTYKIVFKHYRFRLLLIKIRKSNSSAIVMTIMIVGFAYPICCSDCSDSIDDPGLLDLMPESFMAFSLALSQAPVLPHKFIRSVPS